MTELIQYKKPTSYVGAALLETDGIKFWRIRFGWKTQDYEYDTYQDIDELIADHRDDYADVPNWFTRPEILSLLDRLVKRFSGSKKAPK
jgi:hypothetical protein